MLGRVTQWSTIGGAPVPRRLFVGRTAARHPHGRPAPTGTAGARHPPAGRGSSADRPPSTGDHRWDTLLAAVVGRECRLAGIEAPAWTRVPPLRTWWFPAPDPILDARTMQRTPIDLSIKGIWLDASAWESL